MGEAICKGATFAAGAAFAHIEQQDHPGLVNCSFQFSATKTIKPWISLSVNTYMSNSRTCYWVRLPSVSSLSYRSLESGKDEP